MNEIVPLMLFTATTQLDISVEPRIAIIVGGITYFWLIIHFGIYYKDVYDFFKVAPLDNKSRIDKYLLIAIITILMSEFYLVWIESSAIIGLQMLVAVLLSLLILLNIVFYSYYVYIYLNIIDSGGP